MIYGTPRFTDFFYSIVDTCKRVYRSLLPILVGFGASIIGDAYSIFTYFLFFSFLPFGINFFSLALLIDDDNHDLSPDQRWGQAFHIKVSRVRHIAKFTCVRICFTRFSNVRSFFFHNFFIFLIIGR